MIFLVEHFSPFFSNWWTEKLETRFESHSWNFPMPPYCWPWLMFAVLHFRFPADCHLVQFLLWSISVDWDRPCWVDYRSDPLGKIRRLSSTAREAQTPPLAKLYALWRTGKACQKKIFKWTLSSRRREGGKISIFSTLWSSFYTRYFGQSFSCLYLFTESTILTSQDHHHHQSNLGTWVTSVNTTWIQPGLILLGLSLRLFEYHKNQKKEGHKFSSLLPCFKGQGQRAGERGRGREKLIQYSRFKVLAAAVVAF